ncbi:MAG: pseudouridine-5'-phosphate glycosidase [Anaerolineae bacterium]|nr:pseudouridine-5'-phosphate glycosidase [Anaerolineae bacterium]
MQIYKVSQSVQFAQQMHQPIVALETAVLTHGLPFPQNVELAKEMEAIVKQNNAVPATTAFINGELTIGMGTDDLAWLGNPETPVRKISRRDFGIASANRLNGGTTVCGTMMAASLAGIQVFATGGIGGVHRHAPMDVSADLEALRDIPMVVACAGAKSILDLPGTLEVLETYGVPVIGYQTSEFPAFYSRQSGLPVDWIVNTPIEVATIAMKQWQYGLSNAILLVIPPPDDADLPQNVVEGWINTAVEEAEQNGIRGASMTPYLLERINQLSNGLSMHTNLALLKNNAVIASLVAIELNKMQLSKVEAQQVY